MADNPFAFDFALPELDLSKLGLDNPIQTGLRLLFGQSTPKEIGARVAYRGALQVAEQVAPDALRHAASQAGQAMNAARDEWHVWLAKTPYALMPCWGDVGTGKTTLGMDYADRIWAPLGRPILTIGIPQELLPRGGQWQELSIGRLRTAGAAIREDPDVAKDIVRRLVPDNFVLIIDDASLYLNAKAHLKAESFAIQSIINLRRHFGGIIMPLFQDFRDVNREFTKGDAYLMKPPNLLTSGPADERDGQPRAVDRDEVLAWVRKAATAFMRWHDQLAGQGLDKDEIEERRILTVFVACPKVGFVGLDHHRRPSWYDMKVSQNAATWRSCADGESGEPDVIEGEFVDLGRSAS